MPDFANALPPVLASLQAKRGMVAVRTAPLTRTTTTSTPVSTGTAASAGATGTPMSTRAALPMSAAATPLSPFLKSNAQATPFEQALARANAARAKPYASPLKQQQQHQQEQQAQANAAQARARAQSTPSDPYPGSTSLGKSSSQSTSSTKKADQAKPTEALDKSDKAAQTSSTDLGQPLPLGSYPHPNGDNGRGMHWIPTTNQPKAVVDRFVAEAQRMGVKWVTFLNDGANIGQNDYLVEKLAGAGIEPVMRLWSNQLEPIKGDITAMVQHYVGKGVRYFQPFNEPNLNVEQPDGVVSVDRYLDAWIPAAKAIVRGGGLVGFGSLAPGGDFDDVEFLKQALAGLKKRGADNLLNRGWLSMHNYTHNHAIEERADGDGFFKFRAYHKVLREALGRDLPIVGTEGGTFIGEHEDQTQPVIDARKAVEMAQQAYTYMRDQREPWNFVYSYWTIANEAGGGTDASFREHALFRHDGTVNPVVSALRALR
ncbi:MAG TPA: hypothetical protein VGL99_08425 [Chloroflexota bacterium]